MGPQPLLIVPPKKIDAWVSDEVLCNDPFMVNAGFLSYVFCHVGHLDCVNDSEKYRIKSPFRMTETSRSMCSIMVSQVRGITLRVSRRMHKTCGNALCGRVPHAF